MQDLVGQTLKNRYRVEELIGRGGMAEVYKVWDEARADHLAMKVLREDLAQDKIFVRRFEREAQTLANLQHRSIVRFFGLEQEDVLVFLLLEYVEGTSLREQIFRAKGPFSLQQVAEVLRPICAAMHFAHQMGVVHCDLKPGNILINKHGEILVTDFGIARMLDAATSTMVGIGTPAYMAPELIRGEDPTPQTDIYSLGVILYEMLSGGERPFTGERAETTGSTAERIRWEQMKLTPKPLDDFNPQIPSPIIDILSCCLAKEPAERFPNIQNVFENYKNSVKIVGLEECQSIDERKPSKDNNINQEVKAVSPISFAENIKKSPTTNKITLKSTSLLEHIHSEEGSILDFDLYMGNIAICSEMQITVQDIKHYEKFMYLHNKNYYDQIRFYPNENFIGKILLLKSDFDIDFVDIRSNEIIDKLHHNLFSNIQYFDIVQDGQSIVTASSSGKLTCWGKNKHPSFRKISELKVSESISIFERMIEMKLMPQKGILVIATSMNKLNFLSIPDFSYICKVDIRMGKGLFNITSCRSGQFLAIHDKLSTLKIFNSNSILKHSSQYKYKTLSQVNESEIVISEMSFNNCTESISSLVFSPDERTLLIFNEQGSMAIRDIKTLSVTSSQNLGRMNVDKACFSEDGQYLITLCKQRRLDVWKCNWDALPQEGQQ